LTFPGYGIKGETDHPEVKKKIEEGINIATEK